MLLRTATSAQIDPVARGRELGAAFAPQFARAAALYLEHFAELGITPERARAIAERSRAALADWAPGIAAESDAVAAAAGIDRWRVAAVAARTEILAAAARPTEGECSTAVHVGSGPAETLQTWDWHDFLVPDALLLAYTSGTGLRVKTFTEFGTPGKIGVNSAGLGLHFNILSHASDSDAGGVPVHAVARRILDEARSIDDARRLAASAAVSASTVLTVFESYDPDSSRPGSRGSSAPNSWGSSGPGSSGSSAPGSSGPSSSGSSGRASHAADPAGSVSRTRGSHAASLELSPAGLGVVEPAADGWLFHTNHFLDPALAAGDLMPSTDSTTVERLAHLETVRHELAGLDAADRALAACGAQGADAAICISPDLTLPRVDQWATLLTVSVDTVGFGLDVFAGRPDQAAAEGFTRF
ncbi:C45 family autoproteolytic acyltransferase/hydolase [Microbacterium hibisci]|uniref:C45 family autoproteolytic acyltransferase/hydolase n=1 Tax=Microbacterium hibisci TaxID=2036000 RepID=UPI001EF37C54|nr:C45 family peptidase [Microbacterium hibisci]